MLKKMLIFSMLSLVLVVVLFLWVFDKLMVLSGRAGGFNFFSPSPRPLPLVSNVNPLGLSGRSA